MHRYYFVLVGPKEIFVSAEGRHFSKTAVCFQFSSRNPIKKTPPKNTHTHKHTQKKTWRTGTN